MNLNYKSIGKRIKIARINSDLTQEALSEIINLSPTHLSNIETGSTKVSLTSIVNIANALSVSVDDLLCDNIVHTKVQFESDIKDLLDSCNEYEIRIVNQVLSTLISAIRQDAALKKETFYHHPFKKQ